MFIYTYEYDKNKDDFVEKQKDALKSLLHITKKVVSGKKYFYAIVKGFYCT